MPLERLVTSGMTKLWVDDERPLTDEMCKAGWTRSPTAWEALVKLELIDFEVVSLDHDLASFVGNRELTGYDILMWLVQRKMDGKYTPPIVRVHSANPAGWPKMQETIDRYWPGSSDVRFEELP